MLQPLDFGPSTVLGVALGGALVTGVFLVRERYLTGRLLSLNDERRHRIVRATSAREAFLRNSVAAFVRFDAVSFRVREASPGFLFLTGRGIDEDVVERSMVDVLLTESAGFRQVTDAIRREGPEANFELDCRRKDGRRVRLRVNGICRPGGNEVEMALVEMAVPMPEDEALKDKEGDLERFRQGMIRREFRILELKSEINSLCDEFEKPRRYRIDQDTRDVLVEELMREKRRTTES